MTRSLYWLVLVLIFLTQSPVLAQAEQTATAGGKPGSIDMDEQTQLYLTMMYLATMDCKADNSNPDKICWATKEHDERSVLQGLAAYGLRPHSEIGISLMPINTDKPDLNSFVAVAAYNSIGAPVYVYDLAYGGTVRANKQRTPLSGVLNHCCPVKE